MLIIKIKNLSPILLSVISSYVSHMNESSFICVSSYNIFFQKLRNFVKFYTFWCPNSPSFDNEEKERHGQRQKSKWSGKENRFHLTFFFLQLLRRVEPNFKNPPKIRLKFLWNCLQQIDNFWYKWSNWNDQKRKSCESAKSC